MALFDNKGCDGCSGDRIASYDYCFNLTVSCKLCGRSQFLCAECRKENICKNCNPREPEKSSIILEASLMDFDGGVALEL
jgi:hypothetical protein